MTDNARTDHASPDHFEPLTVERAGTGFLTIANTRGATLTAGGQGAEAAFSPEELLQAALAACSVLSAETQLAHVLGEDFDLEATTTATRNDEGDRVEALDVQLDVDMSTLDDAAREKLLTRTDRVIERLCAIKRSLNHGITATAQVKPAEG